MIKENTIIEFKFDDLIQQVPTYINHASTFDTVLLMSLIFFNIIMFFSSKYIFKFLYHNEEKTKEKIKISKVFNLIVPLLIITDVIFKVFIKNYHDMLINIIYSSITIYISLFIIALSSFFIRKEFGTTKEIDKKEIHIENYSSRIFTTLSTLLLIVIIGYILIKIWNLNSLLSDTGIIYIIAAFITITHSIWAPDFYYGFLMLKSDVFNAADIIKIKNDDDEYIIDKILFNFTILANVRNNHKTTMRNSILFNKEIDTLTKLAYPDGLRYSFTYKIGYPKFSDENREEEVNKFLIKVKNMFKEAHQNACSLKNSKYNESFFDVYLKETGDYALEFEFLFFVKGLPKTRLTKVAREYLVKAPMLMNEEVYKMSVIKRIDLSTPDILMVNKNMKHRINSNNNNNNN